MTHGETEGQLNERQNEGRNKAATISIVLIQQVTDEYKYCSISIAIMSRIIPFIFHIHQPLHCLSTSPSTLAFYVEPRPYITFLAEATSFPLSLVQ